MLGRRPQAARAGEHDGDHRQRDHQLAQDGGVDAAILRQLLIALAMISIMLVRPRGLWPAPEHGKAAPTRVK